MSSSTNSIFSTHSGGSAFLAALNSLLFCFNKIDGSENMLANKWKEVTSSIHPGGRKEGKSNMGIAGFVKGKRGVVHDMA